MIRHSGAMAMPRAPSFDAAVAFVNNELNMFICGKHLLKSEEFGEYLLQYIKEAEQSYLDEVSPRFTICDPCNRDGRGIIPADVHNLKWLTPII